MERHGKVRVLVDGKPRRGALLGEQIELEDGPTIAAADATYLPPVEPSKIIAAHLTYRSRIEEYAAQAPEHPSYFLKPPSSLNGHRGEVVRPADGEFLNYEGELAVVVGRRMHRVSAEEALAHVGGYAVANDIGLHDLRHADRGSMLRVKGQDGFLPIGPALVPAGSFDPTSFELRTYLNGELVQEATAEDLIFSVAYQLADLSRVITLEPGDVLLSGTPANSRPMRPGDLVEVEIEGIGRLANTIVAGAERLGEPGVQPEISAQTLHVALAISEAEAADQVGSANR
ncbi:MAG: fumarylacetoacetate hydrolase family protein [Actinobacteria bacterium]|nr:fumarylacetoacetate hydrolase family protein [Actinomycetota bacterium]